MAKFITIPSFDLYKDGTWAKPEQWWLDGECVYLSDITDVNGIPIKVVVPDDFLTDLASIPKIFRIMVPKNGRHRAAAVVHDYLVRTKEVSRKIADKIFLEAMVILEVPKWRRKAMYYAVRLGAKIGGKK